MTCSNFYFLRLSSITYSRRTSCMNELTNALDLDFENKDASSIQYPTINFCCAESLATWLEARKIVQMIGARFALRVHSQTLVFLIFSILCLVSSIAYLAGYVPEGVLIRANVIQLFAYTIGWNVLTLKVMLACANQNVQTNKQIKLLIHTRDQIKRIVNEPCYLAMNPNTMQVRIQQLIL